MLVILFWKQSISYSILPRVVVYLLHGADTFGQLAHGISGLYDAQSDAMATLTLFVPARRPLVGEVESDLPFSISRHLEPDGIVSSEKRETIAACVRQVVEAAVAVPLNLLPILEVFDVQSPVVVGDDAVCILFFSEKAQVPIVPLFVHNRFGFAIQLRLSVPDTQLVLLSFLSVVGVGTMLTHIVLLDE